MRARRARVGSRTGHRIYALALALLFGLAAEGQVAYASETAPAGSEVAPSWAEALTLVDWLGWAGPAAEVERFVASAHRREAVFGASWRSDLADSVELSRLEGAPVYAVELKLEPATLGVRQAVVWTNRGKQPVRQIRLRLATDGYRRGPMRVRVGGAAAPWSLQDAILEVRLPEPLKPGQRARVLLDYALTIPWFVDNDRYREQINVLDVGTFGAARGVFNLASTLALATPMNESGEQDHRPLPVNGEHAWYEPAQFHVMIEVPTGYAVASTGVEVGARTGGDLRTVRLVAAGAREFTLEVSDSYQVLTQDVGGVRVRAFASHEAPGVGERLLADGVGALEHFEALWGPYPWAELDLVEAPVRVALGMEFPQLVTVDLQEEGAWVADESQTWTIAHEVSHQWWHALVGNDPWGEPWVDEALASQASALFVAQKAGADRVASRWRADMVEPYEALADRGVGILPANLPADRYDLQQYSLLVYGKAPLFLEAVRELLGSERYHEALRRYRRQHHLRFARGDDLIEAFRQAARAPGDDPVDPAAIDELFRTWMVEVHPYDVLLHGSGSEGESGRSR